VEYVDIFTSEDIVPSASLSNQLLLFDNFDGINPLEKRPEGEGIKVYQKLYVYITRGSVTITINGKEESLTAPSLISIMPENTNHIKESSPDVQFFMFVVYPKFANRLYVDMGLTYSNAQLSLKHFVSSLTEEQMNRTLKIYLDIKKDLLSPDYEYKEVFVRSLLAALVVENIQIHRYNPMPLHGDSNSRQYDIYCRYLTLLNKHSIEHRTVQYYADLLNISSKYLSFVCNSYSKKNASTWIDNSVIQKAKALMLVHHYSLKQTSEALHFPTVSSFSRFFKRVTHTTPKEFLKTIGN
jgi:AraC-like DNA-binding protein